jgi:hypothetical protein
MAKGEKSESMSWADQNAIGRANAKALIEIMKRDNLPILLGSAVKEMIERGVYDGVEVGFFHEIGSQLIS